jgi:hypothetical protein
LASIQAAAGETDASETRNPNIEVRNNAEIESPDDRKKTRHAAMVSDIRSPHGPEWMGSVFGFV